jgi:2-hydroxychromene-2-carboxylate isomerase
VFREFFAGGVDVSQPAAVAAIAAALDIDASALAAGVQDESIKAALKAQGDEAIARGVFGAPTIFVDGEMFWGNDRLAHVERWISRGPF